MNGLWLQGMNILLLLSLKAARLHIRKQGLDHPDRWRVLADKNVDDISNVMRKPDGKNDNKMPDRGQQVSVITQEKLKLATFLIHHRRRGTFIWEVMGMGEDTVYLVAGQNWLENDCKDIDVLSKENNAKKAGTMKAIKKFLGLFHSMKTSSLAYVI